MIDINTLPSAVDLRYFQEIAFSKNLSRAAERLGVGQPALSLSLKRLEQVIGHPLVFRRKSGLALTSQGEKLLRESHTLLNQWDALLKSVKTKDEVIAGRFTVGCHPSVGSYFLGPNVKKIFDDYDKIELVFIHDLSRNITERLIKGEIDFAYVINPIKHPDLVMKKVADDEIRFWINPNKGKNNTLIYHPELLQTQAILKKIKNISSYRQIPSNSLEVITSLTVAGCGIGILPGRVVHHYADKILKPLNDYPSFSDELYFAYRQDMSKSPASKAVSEILGKPS